MSSNQYAVIAGSGFRDFGDDAATHQVDTDFGSPSAPIRELVYGLRRVFLLPRHGEDLLIPPHAINYCANLQALKQLGATHVIGLNTVGVVTDVVLPGGLAVPLQLIDYTWGRRHSVYDGTGSNLDHIDFTEPFSATMRKDLLTSAAAAGLTVHDGGVYAVCQGPRLETAAEVDKLERDGADYVGMTAMPEAAIARELGLEYACLSLIVNHAAGRGEKSIHADIEASTMSAKSQAMQVLQAFLATD